MIVSTGMNSIQGVHKTVAIMRKYNVDFALMHTTNLYPTSPRMVRLGAMQQLMSEFPDTLVGLSDHTRNNNACLAAAALGASILERHFTDSMERASPDIVCSMDEQALEALIRATREIAQMRGGEKTPLPEEQVTINYAFATVVTIADIKAGEVFSKGNLWVKRPGTGAIPAERYPDIIGRKAACHIPADTHIDSTMIGE
jgi:sialic acid synthase SpsE